MFRIIAYVQENKPFDNFTIKDFSSFKVTLLAATVQFVLRRIWLALTLSFWVSVAKGKENPEAQQKYGQKICDNTF